LEQARNENEEWKGKYVDTEKEKECLFQEIDSYLKEKETLDEVQNEYDLMEKYIRQLGRGEINKVRGKGIPELKTPQGQNRKLKEIKTRAQKALYFVELFGLELDCLKLKSKGGPKRYTVNFASDSPPQTTPLHTTTPQTPTAPWLYLAPITSAYGLMLGPMGEHLMVPFGKEVTLRGS